MFDINSILMCPKCQCGLTIDLKCESCGNQYSQKHGVYNLISLDLSGEQEFLYKREIPDDINLIFPDEEKKRYEKITQEYYSCINRETKEAEEKQDEFITELLKSVSGMICDLATGGGNMLQKILDSKKENVTIVCTDINEFELMRTRMRRNGNTDFINYIATDGRYLSLKENSFDYITSFAGFGNIPDADRVAKEIYRILKPNGKIIIKGSYVEKKSKSFELAKSVGVEHGVIEEYILQDLQDAGFRNIKSTVVAEAIWAENPYDLIPAAGDNQRFCIIEAEK